MYRSRKRFTQILLTVAVAIFMFCLSVSAAAASGVSATASGNALLDGGAASASTGTVAAGSTRQVDYIYTVVSGEAYFTTYYTTTSGARYVVPGSDKDLVPSQSPVTGSQYVSAAASFDGTIIGRGNGVNIADMTITTS